MPPNRLYIFIGRQCEKLLRQGRLSRADNDAGTVCAVQAELHILLEKAGLSRALTEPRYYSELLRQHDAHSTET